LSTVDYDSIDGWNNSNADGSGGGDNESAVTKYSDEIATWSTSSYNLIALNSTAITDATDNDDLYICLIQYDNDLKDIAPTGYNRVGMYFNEWSSSSLRPYLNYVEATTDNAIFFGSNF
jgi:hypothetical protein